MVKCKKSNIDNQTIVKIEFSKTKINLRIFLSQSIQINYKYFYFIDIIFIYYPLSIIIHFLKLLFDYFQKCKIKSNISSLIVFITNI